MEELLRGISTAFGLILSLDPEVWGIASRSLAISSTSVVVASLFCLPLGGVISYYEFRGKGVLINLIQTLYSLPTVCVGLLVFLLLSRAGPLGGLGLLFTPYGMVLGQVVLISPVVTGLTLSAMSAVGKEVKDTALSLGASDLQAMFTLMREAKFGLMAAVIMGFGRAFSEVGVAMMIGGNIRGFTRVLTTAIALETSMGNIEFSIALGVILLTVALGVNVCLNRVQQRGRG